MANLTKEEIENIIEQIKQDESLKQAFAAVIGREEMGTISFEYDEEKDAKALETLKKRAQLQGKIAESTKLAYDQELKLLEERANSNQIAEDERNKILEIIEEIKSSGEVSLARFNIKEIDDSLNRLHKMAEKQNTLNAASKEFAKSAETAASGMADLVGIKTKFTETRVGKLTDLFAQMAGDTEKARGNAMRFGQELATAFSPQNIGASIFTKIFDESMKTLVAYNNAVADLARTTGTVGKFNDVLYDAQRAGNLLGVEMKDVASAITALNAGTTEFAQLNKQTQKQLAISTSQFEKLGVSSQDTAAFMENAFKIMNMGASEAIETQKELAMAGVNLGIGADKIVKDFNAASKTLAVYGKDSIKVFKGLAAQAKAAGVEVSTLLGIVEKFDTFSGAAEGAAKFNALLGTQLSTTQMLMMTEEDRMKTLIESVQAQGVAFGDMDKYTQKAIAAAAGISDMNEANRIFSMSLSDYEANRREMENNAEAQQKFDDAVQATVPTMVKFQRLATELITLVQPALEKLGEVADYLTDAFQSMSKETKEAISMVALFLGGLVTLVPLFSVGGGFIAGMAAIGPAIAGVGTGIATAVSAISAVTMTGVGAAVLGSLAVSGIAIAGIMASMSESEADIAASNARAIASGSDTIRDIASISRADFSGVSKKMASLVQETNKLGGDMKVSANLQNLALISTGQAADLTGAKITASNTNITTNVKSIFEGAVLELEAEGQKFKTYIRNVAAQVKLA